MRQHLVRPALAAFISILAAACADAPLTPPASTEPPPPARRALGVVEVTLTGLADGQTPTASVLSAPSVAELAALRAQRDAASAPGGPTFSPQAFTLPGGGDGTFELVPATVGTFTVEELDGTGVRYIRVTYRLRNTEEDGTPPYPTTRHNLTFLAIDTDATIGQTPISRLHRYDGSAADPALAVELRPTGLVARGSREAPIVSMGPDVLQLFTEGEAADALALASAGVRDVLPYGFVVAHEGSESDRTLPSDPGLDQYDGIVTFAFKLPLQATPADDPFTISATFLAVDDSETRVTQSLEEQDSAGRAAFQERAASLGATGVTLLPKAIYTGAAAPRVLCAVRTAGPAAAPTATLFPAPDTEPWLIADTRALLPTNVHLAAARCGGAWNPPDAANFVVNGSQSGRAFLGQSYTREGAVVRAPGGAFFPGEEVEVVLRPALGLSQTIVTRYRIGGAPALASFAAAASIAVPTVPTDAALGDVNGDGALDIVASSDVTSFTDTLTVLLGNGAGGFPSAMYHTVPSAPRDVDLGDVNGDGALDIVTANQVGSISVLLGDGLGGFSGRADYTVGTGTQPLEVALGDLNGDGALDIVTCNYGSDNVSVLLSKDGGGFQPGGAHDVGIRPSSVALGDVNGDGALDIVTPNESTDNVSVLLGDGFGGVSARVDHAGGDSPTSVALGDLNGDGALDIATAAFFDDVVRVRLGDGLGGFAAATTHPAGSRPNVVALGDVNGDGALDIVTSNFGSHNLSVLLSDGLGDFGAPVHRVVGGQMPWSLALGDVNEDGALDIVAANRIPGTLIVRYNER